MPTDSARGATLACFPFGGTYVPVVKATPVRQEDWDQDLRSFREEGFTAVRGWIPWDRIERAEGVRDYSAPDRLLELAEKHDLRVMLNIGGVFDNLAGLYPPRWLIGRCQPPVLASGAASMPTGPRRSVCMNDPLHREKAKGFLEEAVRRFAQSPALFAWGIWNEPSWQGCYCPHCVKLFREWLERRYGSVEALDRRWGTEFPVLYRSFGEVEPPVGVGFLEGGYSAWIDWNEFAEDALASALRWVDDIVKANDPLGRPTTLNLTPGDLLGAAPRRHANPSKIGQIVDVLGFSHYTYREQDPRDFAMRLDRVRSSSRTGEVWIIETESGPVYWVHANMPGHTRTRERLLRYWQAVGRNVTALFFWLYRTRLTDAQSGEFGLRAWDGSPTERSAESGRMSRFLQEHAELLGGREVPREIAIWSSAAGMRLGAAEGYEDVSEPRKRYWSRSARGAYHMGWDLGYRVDFVDESTPRERLLRGYRAILVPFCPTLDEPTARLFEEYVEGGGLIVADFPFGFKSAHGDLFGRNPGLGLDRVFGCHAVDALPVEPEDGEMEFRSPGGVAASFRPGTFIQTLTLSGSGRSIASCAGKTAAASSVHGKGRAVLFGTMFFAPYDEERGEARPRREALGALLAEHGVLPRFAVSAVPRSPELLLEACPLVKREDDSDVLCAVANHGALAATFSLLVRARVSSAREVGEAKGLRVSQRGRDGEETEIVGTVGAKSAVKLALRLAP